VSAPFTDDLWRSIERTYAAVLEHPFLRELQTGALDRESFRYYVVQDAHYLRGYARALAVVAARAPTEGDIQTFAEHAAGAIAVERTLHEGFLADFGMSEADLAAEPVAPTCLAYVSYLVATAYSGSYAEALGAVLPCYWIYWEVGKELIASGSPDPLYQRWIDTYGGDEYAAVVRQALEATERAGAGLSAGERDRVREHFQTTARYEWLFWDAGYRREGWRV
jgi:thiaminase/transcriptional activator TenA